MTYHLFIDDERFPVDSGWAIARSSQEAMDIVTDRGWPLSISFDHDLGGNDTSMVFVHWAILRLLEEGRGIPFQWSIHSQNPIGAANIDGLLNSYARSCLR